MLCCCVKISFQIKHFFPFNYSLNHQILQEICHPIATRCNMGDYDLSPKYEISPRYYGHKTHRREEKIFKCKECKRTFNRRFYFV